MSDLPVRPSLSSLRKQAKSLLSDFRDGSENARSIIQEHHPKPDQFGSLRDAQLVIARKYGYQGWSELNEAVEDALNEARSLDELADLFTDLVCLCYSQDENVQRRERAGQMIMDSPEIARSSIYSAAAAFDIEALRSFLEKDPSLANQVGGPRDWAPLMYIGFSRAPESLPGRDAVEAARVLLDHGADPRFYIDGRDGWGGWRWTAITGAIGEGESGDVHQSPHSRARELVELLLDAGADPNDSQALYNYHFTPSNDWFELFLSRGLTAESPTDPDDPLKETTLNFHLSVAVRRGYTERVKLLLEHGADATGRDDRYTNRTYVENAVLSGYGEILDLLVEHGAERPELTNADRFRFAVSAGDESSAREILDQDPSVIDQPGSLVGFASANRLDAVRLFLKLGIDPNKMNKGGRGAIHEAAWSGHREMIDILLDGGARLDVRSEAHEGTALGYANHAGRFGLRDYLMDRTNDLFDLVAYNRVDRIEAVLSEEPDRIHVTKPDGTTPMDIAKEKGNRDEAIEILKRYGAEE